MRKRGPLVAAVMILTLLHGAPALAHAERVGSTPEEGVRLRSTPDSMLIQFSEPPIGDATFVVTDGCDRAVVDDIEVQNMEIEAALAGGQPGRWRVQTRVVSGVDGHATSDQWSFRVRGRPDCDQPAPDSQGEPDEENEDGGEGGEGEASSFPLFAFALGTLLVIVLALVFRGRSG